METENKTIKNTLRVTIDKRYDEVVVVDEHYSEIKIIGYDWEQAGYTWEKDIQPIIDLVKTDEQEREITMTREKVVKTFGNETTERMIDRLNGGYSE